MAFCDVTVLMSSGSDVTLSQVVPDFNVLLDHEESSATHHNHIVQDATEKAKTKLTSYYQKTSDVYTIADVLDPRLVFTITHVLLLLTLFRSPT